MLMLRKTLKENVLVKLHRIEYCAHSHLKNRRGLSSLMGPRWTEDCVPPLTGRESAITNIASDSDGGRVFKPSAGVVVCPASRPWHLRPMTEEPSQERAENEVGGRWATTVHLRLIKRSEARRRLWRRLIKGLKGERGELFMPRLFFFLACMWPLEKGIKWRPEQLISHKAQFPCFILADGRRL